MFHGIWLILLSLLAVPSLLTSRRPDAAAQLAKLAPYQGWFGAISVFGGAWGVISALLHMGWLAHWPIYWVTWLADGIVLFSLGILLGVGVLKSFIKNAEAQRRMDQTIARIAPYQGTLGIVGLVLGVWMVVASLLFRVG